MDQTDLNQPAYMRSMVAFRKASKSDLELIIETPKMIETRFITLLFYFNGIFHFFGVSILLYIYMYPEASVMKGYSPSELGGDRQHAGSLTGENFRWMGKNEFKNCFFVSIATCS